MTEDPPSHPGVAPHAGPPVGQWAPGYPAHSAPQAPRSRMWPAIAIGAMVLALVSTVVAVIALVATSRSSTSSSGPTAATPTYSAADVSAAHQKLCDAYKLEARAVQIETNGTDQALSGIATINGALILQDALSTTPALPPDDRAAARALAEAYSNAQATAATVQQRNDPLWQSTISDVNAKDAAMKKVCGGG